MTKQIISIARMGTRKKITGLSNLSLADIKKIYRDEYKRVTAELRAWNMSKIQSRKLVLDNSNESKNSEVSE